VRRRSGDAGRVPQVVTLDMARLVYDLLWADPATPEQEYVIQSRLRAHMPRLEEPVLGTPRVRSARPPFTTGDLGSALATDSGGSGGLVAQVARSLRGGLCPSPGLAAAEESESDSVAGEGRAAHAGRSMSEASSVISDGGEYELDGHVLELAFLDRAEAEESDMPREHLPRVVSFSNEAVNAFCRATGVDLILRGHTLKDDGFGLEKQRRVLTIFSDSKDHGINGRSGWVLIEDRGEGEGKVHMHLGGQSWIH